MSSPTHVRRHVRASLVSLLLGTTVALHRPLPVMRRSSAIQACANTEAFLDARSVEHSDFETSEEALRSAQTAFALLVNVGSGNEGIYSRKLPTNSGGSVDLVVTFEDLDDATRYSAMLGAEEFPETAPTEVDTSELLAFCSEGRFVLGLVRQGTLVVPPTATVEEFAWSPGASEEGLQAEPTGQSREELEAQRSSLEALMKQAN